MSILECILIDASSGEIKLTGNDMELGIETTVNGEILEHGKIALDAKPVSYTHLQHLSCCHEGKYALPGCLWWFLRSP